MTWTGAKARKTKAQCISLAGLLLVTSGWPAGFAQGQDATRPPRRIHLILQDGSFQLVTDYRVSGGNVVYHSAERGGAEEVIPVSLVDLQATHLWEERHTLDAQGRPTAPPAIDPELLKEEAERKALTPEIAPDLQLPEQDSVLALDTFHSIPELVPVAQSDGQLNRNTAHNVLLGTINPVASAHPIVTLQGMRSAIQVHVPDPVFYVRIGDDAGTPASGSALTVDTHGASGNAPSANAGGSANSRYVIVRADVRTDSRVLSSFSLSSPQDGRPLPDDVTEVVADPLAGGHWMKLTPKRSLDFGEFALLEILDAKRINLGVWDFGVHPAAAENRDAIKPEPKRRPNLDRRSNDQ